MSVVEVVRKSWVERDELPPLHAASWVGLAMAVVTLALVLFTLFGRGLLADAGGETIFFQGWCVLYAAGLAWGWWRMRPRADVLGSFVLSISGLLFQGVSYLLLWGGLAGVFGDHGGRDGDGSSGLSALALGVLLAFAGLFVVGPVFGCIALFATRRGGWMFAAQLLGLGGSLVLALLG
ncbi:MAG: hypothetical protein P1V36_15670 [Planctomycetota bacterium]|nr:hypothetical protein [Planctomycetota bacterium]